MLPFHAEQVLEIVTQGTFPEVYFVGLIASVIPRQGDLVYLNSTPKAVQKDSPPMLSLEWTNSLESAIEGALTGLTSTPEIGQKRRPTWIPLG